MKVGKDLKNCYEVVLTMRFLSSSLFRVFTLVQMSTIGRW